MLANRVVKRLHFGRQATQIVVALVLRAVCRAPDAFDHDHRGHAWPALHAGREQCRGYRKAASLLSATMACVETTHAPNCHARKVLRGDRLPELVHVRMDGTAIALEGQHVVRPLG